MVDKYEKKFYNLVVVVSSEKFLVKKKIECISLRLFIFDSKRS